MRFFYIALTILLSFQLPAKLNNDQVMKIKDLYNESLVLSGEIDDMEQRALLFAKIFYDSQKQLSFAITIAHLTLGIDRASRPERAIKFFNRIGFKDLTSDWLFWGKSLRRINQKMFQRFYFAYRLSELMTMNGFSYDDIDATDFSLEFEEVLIDVDQILNDFITIHKSVSSGTILSDKIKHKIFENFVYWEHISIIQPELDKIYDKLHSVLKYTLQNVPSRNSEKYFLEPLFDLRTTYNLSCFKDSETYLRTDNFLDPDDRIEQAIFFFDQIKESIDKMSIIECFKDSYYRHNIPQDFFGDTEKFLEDYRLKILRNNKISVIN
ncbi:MAG: hypothetical protein H6622_16520 [Halobacteriovoraceae bacterium]|nr:hypothetical protein [Halobacteriovoraceae bacterium]